MTLNNLFPCSGRRVRMSARLAFAAFACLSASGLLSSSAVAQTNRVRPVARLIGVTSGGIESARSRETVRATGARVMPTSMSGDAVARPRMTSIAPTSMEQRAFALINAQRQARGEAPLVWDAELTRVARLHSDNMAQQNFFDHTDPQGRNAAMRARATGVRDWSALAENIAYNSGYDDPAAFAVERWLLSAKHRANILRDEFTHSGIGVARAADGRVFFTQVFISR